MRSINVTRHPDQSRLDRRCAQSATLVVRESHGSGPLAAHRRRFTDRVLAQVFGPSLDHQLAAGRPPSQVSYWPPGPSPSSASAGAGRWPGIGTPAGHGPAPRCAGPGPDLLCWDRIFAAEPDIHEMVARLRAPLPVAARGVAAAELLLTDAAGPLYNRRNQVALPALLRLATAQLDPAASLAEQAVA